MTKNDIEIKSIDNIINDISIINVVEYEEDYNIEFRLTVSDYEIDLAKVFGDNYIISGDISFVVIISKKDFKDTIFLEKTPTYTSITRWHSLDIESKSDIEFVHSDMIRSYIRQNARSLILNNLKIICKGGRE